jgi:hypothetical protein
MDRTNPPGSNRFVLPDPLNQLILEVLRSARDNRGSLVDVPPDLTAAVALLARADMLEVDVVGFRLTLEGDLLLARVEEQENAPRPDG